MMKKVLMTLGFSALLLTTACTPEQINSAASDLLSEGTSNNDKVTNSNSLAGGSNSTGSSTGSSSGTGAATGSGSTATSTAPNAKFSEFLKAGDTYFGPAGTDADIDSGVSGNAAAGSRYGGPGDAVGVMVVVRNSRGFMEVVNLQNKNRFDVLDINGDPFDVPADTLGGKPFPSLFVIDIPSLTTFTFDHRISPNPAVCNNYTATFTGTVSDGHYVARRTAQGACRF
ncbi:MAG: hypothetical protein ACO1RX_18235 [Candidatus Sericytochromatia bacterium]